MFHTNKKTLQKKALFSILTEHSTSNAKTKYVNTYDEPEIDGITYLFSIALFSKCNNFLQCINIPWF